MKQLTLKSRNPRVLVVGWCVWALAAVGAAAQGFGQQSLLGQPYGGAAQRMYVPAPGTGLPVEVPQSTYASAPEPVPLAMPVPTPVPVLPLTPVPSGPEGSYVPPPPPLGASYPILAVGPRTAAEAFRGFLPR